MKESHKAGANLGVAIVGSLVLGAMLALLPLSSLSAGEKGNDTKGKFFFKQSCKPCHVKGE